MSRAKEILDYIIAYLDEITDLNIDQRHVEAGARVTMSTVNTFVTFNLHGRKVAIHYIQHFPVIITDPDGKIVESLDGGAELQAG